MKYHNRLSNKERKYLQKLYDMTLKLDNMVYQPQSNYRNISININLNEQETPHYV